MVQDVLREFPLAAHRRGLPAADALDRAAEQARIVEVFLVETVIAKLVGFRLQYLCEALNLITQIQILLAENYAHAA